MQKFPISPDIRACRARLFVESSGEEALEIEDTEVALRHGRSFVIKAVRVHPINPRRLPLCGHQIFKGIRILPPHLRKGGLPSKLTSLHQRVMGCSLLP